jgi:ankyrin repeat protein
MKSGLLMAEHAAVVPTTYEMEALRAYRGLHGDRWRTQLLREWTAGRGPIDLDDLRRRAGPSVLMRIRLVDPIAPEDLVTAAQRGDVERVAHLLRAGADPNVPFGEEGETALHVAATGGTTEALAIVDLLLGAGANPWVRALDGATPLHYAAAHGRLLAAVSLLRSGADPNAQGAGGVAPLHMAAYRGDRVLVEKILASGALANIQTYEGVTPADMAAEAGHDSLADALARFGE